MNKLKVALEAGVSACAAAVIYCVCMGITWCAFPWAWHPWLFVAVSSAWGCTNLWCALDHMDDRCRQCAHLTVELNRANQALAELDLRPARRAGRIS